jgi:hypothetical protein
MRCYICGRELEPEDMVLIDFSPSYEIVYFCSKACRDEFREKVAVDHILDLMIERLYKHSKAEDEDMLSKKLRTEIEDILKKMEGDN